MTEFLKSILGLQGKKPSSVLVKFVDPDNKDNILCQWYSYSVWQRVEAFYSKVLKVVAVEPFYND